MAKSRGRKFAEITSPSSGVFDLTSVPTITNAKLQNSAMTLAGSSVSLGGTGVANTDALSEGSSNVYFTDARVQTFLGGGTLAGNIVVPDNRSIYLGSNSDFRLVHNTTNTQLINATGALQITSNGGFDVTGAATFSSTITATGNITGTLATAAQTNITSLGTLTALTSSGDITISTGSGTGGRYLILDNTDTGGRDYRLISTNNAHGSLGGGDFAILDYDVSGNDAAKTRLLINSSGNVGIGVTSPGAKLSVSGPASLANLGGGSTGSAAIYVNSTSNHTGEMLQILKNGSTKMEMSNSGNLGIGVTPSAWSGFSGVAQVHNSALASVNNGAYLYANAYYDGSNNRHIATDEASRYYQLGGNHVWETAASATAGSAVSFSEFMRINSSGHVGIGESNPARRLSVRRDTGITAGFNDISQFLDTTLGAGGSVSLNLGRANSTKNLGKMAFKYAGSGSNANALNFGFYDADNLMTLLANGNVGIGDTTPGYKLEVNGTAHVVNTLTAGAIGIPSQGITLNQGFGTGVPTLTTTGTNSTNGRAGAILFNEYGDVNCAAIYSTDGAGGNANYGGLLLATYQSDIRFSTSGLSNTRMIIKANGNVGIGTGGTASKKLHITGNDNQLVIDGNAATANSGLFFAEQGTDKWEVYHRGADDTFRIYNYATSSPNLLITSAGRLQLDKYSIKFDGTDQGKHEIRTGGRTGTGTYTLFTNGSSTTQSAGIVEVWGIYGTPSGASYRLYVISGNRSIATAVAHTQTNSVPTPTLAWSGAALQISNSNGSLYYHVRVTLHDIGNSWAATWGNFPGIG